jgi:hypothetical protein
MKNSSKSHSRKIVKELEQLKRSPEQENGSFRLDDSIKEAVKKILRSDRKARMHKDPVPFPDLMARSWLSGNNVEFDFLLSFVSHDNHLPALL